jgi:hypothetical protein
MRIRSSLVVAAIAVAAPAAQAAGVRSSFLYGLSDAASRRAMGWASLNWDPQNSELFVVGNGVVDIFNENGLATYAFGEDTGLGLPIAVAALPDGELFVLAAKDGASLLVRCNFRGEPLAPIDLTAAAKQVAPRFNPNAIAVADGKLYLADKSSMNVVVVDRSGAAVASYELAKIIGLGPRDAAEAMMRGFNVDGDGNLLFTVASVFSAYVVSPAGKVRAFGSKGSSPGKFNIVSGIAADEEGRLFLTDSLRSVVMVFDKDFRFLGEFGYRGPDPDNLISPFDVAVGNGRVYVSQSRGAVKAFAVRFD